MYNKNKTVLFGLYNNNNKINQYNVNKQLRLNVEIATEIICYN